MNEPTHLDLFSGIGGFALAAQWAGFRTIGFCEIDKYCQKVLAKNFPNSKSTESRRLQHSKLSTDARTSCPIFSNIFDLDGRDFAGVDLITGGFPCQPFSVAGKRGGAADDRAIWPQMFRVINEARPAWVLGENVPGIIPMELDNVLSDLEGIGYATRSFVIPACAVDARHRRMRVWIVGYAERTKQERSGNTRNRRNGSSDSSQDVADSYLTGSQGRWRLGELEHTEGRKESIGLPRPCSWPDESEWFPQSAVCRVAHGIPSRVDRLKGLGNAIVPQVAYEILREIRNLI